MRATYQNREHPVDASYLQDRITATKSLIEAYEDAALALASGGLQEYTIDTQQSRQVVTKFNISALTRQIDVLYNRLSTLQARAGGGGVTRMVPAW